MLQNLFYQFFDFCSFEGLLGSVFNHRGTQANGLIQMITPSRWGLSAVSSYNSNFPISYLCLAHESPQAETQVFGIDVSIYTPY